MKKEKPGFSDALWNILLYLAVLPAGVLLGLVLLASKGLRRLRRKK